jgi:hypothetical protein
VSTLSNQRFVHRERAARFNKYALITNNLGTREMYLRLGEQEIALAERLERLEHQARDHADQQARADTKLGAATLNAPE